MSASKLSCSPDWEGKSSWRATRAAFWGLPSERREVAGIQDQRYKIKDKAGVGARRLKGCGGEGQSPSQQWLQQASETGLREQGQRHPWECSIGPAIAATLFNLLPVGSP